jgi:hypothetical protein
MVVWRGIGCAAAFIGFFIFLGVALFVGEDYWESHHWPMLVAGGISLAVIWFLGRYLNTRPGRTVIDKATGKELVLRTRHDLFFIPFEWWGIIFAIFALISLFIKF